MTLPAWPAQVSTEPRDGWGMPAMFVAPESSDMEGGNQRLRTKPGSNVAVVDYPLKPLDGTAWGYLNTFLRTTLSNGASRFTMSVWIAGTAATKTCQLEQGQPPRVSHDGVYAHVVLRLRVYGVT